MDTEVPDADRRSSLHIELRLYDSTTMERFGMKRLVILGIAALAAVLSGCATTNLPGMSEMLRDTTDQNGRACVRESDIDGYGVLENDVISIDGGQDYYLATVLPGCNNLATSIGLMFSNNFGEICGQSGDEVRTDRETCQIHQVFQFDDREEAFDAFNDVMEARERMGEE